MTYMTAGGRALVILLNFVVIIYPKHSLMLIPSGPNLLKNAKG